MTDQTLETYLLHPSFHEAMNHFQSGSWETGLTQLDELRTIFPLDNELRALRHEMQLKAKIDIYEIEEKQLARKQLLKKVFIRSSVSIVTIGLLIWGGITYSSWIQQQWTETQQRIQNEALAIDLSIQFRNAQNLLMAGRAAEAKVLFQAVEEVDPDFPELDYFLNETDAKIQLGEQYENAMTLLKEGDTQEALGIFKAIADKNPLYRDVALQIDNIERGFLLNAMQADADLAFQDENWAEAISSYEAILALNPRENSEEIEEQLFLSYISAAEIALNDPAGTFEALESAEEYFKKALVLRPQNEEVLDKWAEAKQTIKTRLVNSYIEEAQFLLEDRSDSLEVLQESLVYLDKALALEPDDARLQTQVNLVNGYLDAIDAYQKFAWHDVIVLLEPIVAEANDFANGVALQTLYEAYIVQGNDAVISGLYEEALINYQRAAVIAQQSTRSTLLIFEAQLQAAKAQGLLFNYEAAVSLFQLALEQLQLDPNNMDLEVKSVLANAEAFVAEGDFHAAYTTYEELFDHRGSFYDTSLIYVVGEDDYLTLIASKYNTTVDAIVKANGIENINNIGGRELVIPTLDK